MNSTEPDRCSPLRKRDDFETQGLDILADALGEQPENNLQAGNSARTNIGIIIESIPSHLDTSLHFGTPFNHGVGASMPPRIGKVLQGFFSTTNPTNTTVFSPLMTSSQGILNTFKSSEFYKKFMDNSPDFPKFPLPHFTTSSLPSLPTSFRTLDSFCSSVNATATDIVNKHIGFEPILNAAGEGTSTDKRPTKRSKIKKYMSKTRKYIAQIFEGMAIQNNMLMYLMIEHQIMRDWLITNVCSPLNITRPPPNPPPHVLDFPQPENATSSDDSSLTVAK
jgi:hypothetical protein